MAQAGGVGVFLFLFQYLYIDFLFLAQSVFLVWECTRLLSAFVEHRTLLNYLVKKDIMATFFVVGSRVIERPDVLIEEYMAGHEISVHTWSHRVCLDILRLRFAFSS